MTWSGPEVTVLYQDDVGRGVLLLPNTFLVFLGAGDRLLCHDIKRQKKPWKIKLTADFRFGRSPEISF